MPRAVKANDQFHALSSLVLRAIEYLASIINRSRNTEVHYASRRQGQ